MPSVERIVSSARKACQFNWNCNGPCPMRQFMLPDLGEGLEEAEIVTWYVNEGDHVVTDQPLVSVETDKAVVEIPSPSRRTYRAPVRRQGRYREGRRAARPVCRGRRAGHRHNCRRAWQRRTSRRQGSLPRDRLDRCFRRCAHWRASSTSIFDSLRGPAPAAASLVPMSNGRRSVVAVALRNHLRGLRRAMASTHDGGPCRNRPRHGDG